MIKTRKRKLKPVCDPKILLLNRPGQERSTLNGKVGLRDYEITNKKRMVCELLQIIVWGRGGIFLGEYTGRKCSLSVMRQNKIVGAVIF